MSDAYRRHCADSSAESRAEAYAAWNERVDCVLRDRGLSPAAFTGCERWAAFDEGMGADDAADYFGDFIDDACSILAELGVET